MKKKIISILTAAVLSVGMLFVPAASHAESGTPFTINAEAAVSVAAPTADKKSGYHLMDSEKLLVNLSCSTKNAVIYYKANNGSYKKYTNTLAITRNMTISAYAQLNGVKSTVVTYDYKLYPNYTLSVKAGSYSSDQVVKVTSKVPGVKFYYATNGKQASASSHEFPAGGLKLRNTINLSVYAYKEGWTGSGDIYTYNISKLNNYKYNYYYSQLSANEKTAYGRIYNAIQNGAEKVSLEDLNLTNKNLDKIITAFTKDVYNWVGFTASKSWCYWTAYEGSVKCIDFFITYNKNDPTILATQKKVEAAAAKVISEAQKKSTDYEKIKYIHDWIILNNDYISYTENYDALFIDAPFLKGFANCKGYTGAFMYMARSMGYECIAVTGHTAGKEDSSHVWNKIKLNGTWYNVDVAWDEHETKGVEYRYFLKSDKSFSDWHIEDDLSGGMFTVPAAPKDYSR